MGRQDDAPENFREEQPRYARSAARLYANDKIEVSWEPRFCIHAAECIRGAPAVFDSKRRPWIEIDNDSPDTIADVVHRCPTGALHFRRLDDGAQEPVPPDTTVEAQPDGPLYVRGEIRIVGQDGELLRTDTRVALCRCGHSSTKPFCDGTHRKIEFRTTDG